MSFNIRNILRLIRTHQYLKNLFIFLPLFFTGQITNPKLLLNAIIAFVAFSASASAIYILNDFLDIEEDLQHPNKKFRPLAAGIISKNQALLLIGIFSIIGISLMATQSLYALIVLLIYIILNISYCFSLKHIAIVDITIIAIGFVLRLFIGSFVTEIPLSKWIVMMTFLLALFLALAKRRDDVLHFMDSGKKMRKVIDGYNLQFIDGAMMIMASVVIVSYILYTTSIEVVQRIQSEYLYLTSLFVILGILRYLQLSFVENNSASPTKIILKDKFMILTILTWVLSFVYLIYF
ncbi:decaprenyl-phosphate phosphoribosyltransferase [Candidatus Atribacteria bacterium HGW-Atribacteria-1]|nr:MAG: decaprenyl-phosphate phosphoribosyltransferase [Candidatus Atribacteria bacterium HGW-Atribacteria-1]